VIAPSYYHQYTITFGYGDKDSSTITSGSQIGSYYQFGSSSNAILAGSSYGATAPTSAWVDAGSGKVSYQTYTSGTQRWALLTSPTSFTVSSSTTISDTSYYHQYTITFGYGDKDSSTITSGSQIGSYYQFGSSSGTILAGSSYGSTSPTSDWVDAGTAKVSYQTFTSSSGTERWALSSSPDNRAVSSSTTISESAYYHQYMMTLSYSVTGGSGYSAPSLSANAFGALAPQTLTTTATGYWFDAGASWTVTNPLGGGSGNYRWYTTQSTSGTVSVQTIAFVYNYQVFGIDTNCEGFGSLTANGGTITTSSMTAQANELIIVIITIDSTSRSVTSITDSFSTHLNWHQRVATNGNPYGGNGEGIFEYWAVTDSSHTGGFKVNVTISSGHSNHNMCVQAIGITGANTANPFDSHSGLPYTATGSSGTPTVSGVYTSNANDTLLAFEGDQSSSAQTAGSGFTATNLVHNVNGQGNNAEYKIVSSTQSNINVGFGSSASNWVMIADAVQRAW
jgi:hypothetical protein